MTGRHEKVTYWAARESDVYWAARESDVYWAAREYVACIGRYRSHRASR